MNAKNWMVPIGLILLGGALAVGGFILGRSAGRADSDALLAKYTGLVAADNALMGQLGSSLGGALAESKRLSSTGSGLEQSIRTVAVLANGLHDAISAIARYEKARGSGGPGSGQVSPQP